MRSTVLAVTFAVALGTLAASAAVAPSPDPAPPATAASAAPSAAPSGLASPGAAASPLVAFATPAACDNSGFIALQAQSQDGYREVTVCGNVVQVLPEKITATGRLKYFSISLDAGGDTIEIATDVRITGEFDVRVGALANVHGRYHREGIGSQSIDRTHHVAGPSDWTSPGYVQLDGGRLID